MEHSGRSDNRIGFAVFHLRWRLPAAGSSALMDCGTHSHMGAIDDAGKSVRAGSEDRLSRIKRGVQKPYSLRIQVPHVPQALVVLPVPGLIPVAEFHPLLIEIPRFQLVRGRRPMGPEVRCSGCILRPVQSHQGRASERDVSTDHAWASWRSWRLPPIQLTSTADLRESEPKRTAPAPAVNRARGTPSAIGRQRMNAGKHPRCTLDADTQPPQ